MNEEFCIESYVHYALFCGMRGQYPPGVARIPKPECLLRITFDEVPNTPVIGMHHMDKTLRQATEDGDLDTIAFCDCILAIAKLLQTLQARYTFMHRDLHARNVMLRAKRLSSKREVNLIDFGMARMVTTLPGGGAKRLVQQPDGLYGPHNFNASHDLRLLMFSMVDRQSDPGGAGTGRSVPGQARRAARLPRRNRAADQSVRTWRDHARFARARADRDDKLPASFPSPAYNRTKKPVFHTMYESMVVFDDVAFRPEEVIRRPRPFGPSMRRPGWAPRSCRSRAAASTWSSRGPPLPTRSRSRRMCASATS